MQVELQDNSLFDWKVAIETLKYAEHAEKVTQDVSVHIRNFRLILEVLLKESNEVKKSFKKLKPIAVLEDSLTAESREVYDIMIRCWNYAHEHLTRINHILELHRQFCDAGAEAIKKPTNQRKRLRREAAQKIEKEFDDDFIRKEKRRLKK